MTTYTLLNNATTTSANPIFFVHTEQGGPSGDTPPSNQVASVVLRGQATCTATVQLMVSNDTRTQLLNGQGAWQNYGSPLTITANAAEVTPATGNITGTAAWEHFGAIVTSISGLNANVTVKLSC